MASVTDAQSSADRFGSDNFHYNYPTDNFAAAAHGYRGDGCRLSKSYTNSLATYDFLLVFYSDGLGGIATYT